MSDCELDDTLPNISIQEPKSSIADQSNCQDNRLRVTYLHRLMKEYDQRSEMNKQQIENIDPEIIDYQPNAYDINDENIELDAKQKRLLKMIVGNSSGNFPILKPELERFFLLEKSNRLRYNYPPECCTETYKQLLREAAPNITDSKITTYAMSLTDQFRFKVFFDQIPSIELKKQILDSFLLNCLTFKSTLKLHHAYGLIEGVLDDTSELSCPEWYITDMLLLKLFVSLGLDVKRFKATFPNILEVFTDCGTEEEAKQENKQVDAKIFEMSLRHVLRLTRNSIIKRLTLYENQEFYVIFYLMCAVVLDANIEQDESIQEEVGDIFEQLFNLDFLDIDELSATLIKGLRLNNQTIAYHRLVYLIKRINTKRKCTKKLSDFSTQFALSCLYGIFKEFTNEVSTVNEKLSTPKMVDLIIDLLEKHSIDIYKDSSYKMFNIIELLTILVNSYILNLQNANVYMKRLMGIIENAIHSVRDHIYDLGIIQVKIILSHFTDKCDNFLEKYKAEEQMDTSLSHSLIE